MRINIAHLYPDLLNLYGDKGNIASLVKRLEWRGIEAQVTEYKIEDEIDFADVDIILLGGGTDGEQTVVIKRLMDFKESLKEYVEAGGVLLASCGGYQMLGKYFTVGKDKAEGLGILDITTDTMDKRFIGDIAVKTEFSDIPVVGFENHSGSTNIGKYKPMGQVIFGSGNNGKDKTEGIIYKNTYGTYLHGPLLPKNPHLCDVILEAAIKNRDESFVLSELEDSMEYAANKSILKRYVK